MRHVCIVLGATALVLVAGCTVALPDADHFPEGRDVWAQDLVADTADVSGVEVKADAADSVDAKDAVALDAADGADVGSDADADGDTATSPDVADGDAAADDVADAADAVPNTDSVIADVEADVPIGEDVQDAAVDVALSCTSSQCDDGNPCTLDECGSNDQCVHSNLAPTPCPDDGLPCTGDSCQDGNCTHTTLLPGWCIIAGACFASGDFTADGCATCQPSASPVAWTALPDTVTCSDGTACTLGDHCQDGACLPGATANCDDGNPCTADVCDPATGCGNPNLDDGSGCPAPGVCKLPGYCASGACLSAPKLWATSMDGGASGEDRFHAVAVTASGEFVVAGARTGGTGVAEGWALQLNAASDVVEILPALGDGVGAAHYSSVAVAADGALALGGATSPDAIVRVIQASGVVQTSTPFAAFGPGDVPVVVAQGAGWLALDAAGHCAQLDAVGATVWLAQATALGAHVLRGVVGMPDGGAIAVGTRTAPGTDTPAAVAVRFSSSGAILWQRGFGDAATAFLAVHLRTDGNLAVAGTQGGDLRFDRLSMAGEWLGSQLWTPPLATTISAAAVTAADDGWRLVGSADGKAWQGAFDRHGNPLWQRSYDIGIGHGLALLPSGGQVLVGETAAPVDALIVRADAWGEATCAGAQLCSNLTLDGCDDGLPCTADLCGSGVCSHNPLGAAPCDDGDPCLSADVCASGACVGIAALGDTTIATASQFNQVAGLADGGAVVAGTAKLVNRLDAAGKLVWSTFLAGGAVSDVAALANGWVVILQGESGGTLQRFSDNGAAIPGALNVDGATGGKSVALAVLRDDSIVVVGTVDVGAPSQAAFIERFDGNGVGVAVSLPGSFGLSQALAVAASGQSGCAVLTVEGGVARLHRMDGELNELWSTPLSIPSHSALAAMPDDGWLAAGLGPKGLALERHGPDGAFEFAEQWPVPGLTSVASLAVLPDGTSAVAVTRLNGGFSQGGLARFGPLGALLALDWGTDGSQLLAVAAAARPFGIWAVGNRPGGAWLRRTDSHGGNSCAVSGTCISQSLICNDGNPCSNDGCAAGKCTANLPLNAHTCLDGGTCSDVGACPLLGTCGDAKCNVNETSTSCASDCAVACDAMNCDDGDPCTVDYCQAGNCAIGGASDGTPCAFGKVCGLGQCVAASCGDGVCDSGETASSCPTDCPVCGDGLCGAGENNHLCPADCAKPASGCQNLCGWKSQKPGGGVCWCDATCTPGPLGDCCDDKATFCP